ncbi:hypothetical protein EV363DRAFT_1314913 [Boletus edulis]|nr:hypothetical protein EV363DRAFT_1314913 [Boletus edulis]
MDVDEPANFFEFFTDDFEKGEHEQLDKKIYALFPQVTSENLEIISPYILLAIAEESGDLYPDVQEMILDGSKNGYQKLRLLKHVSQVGQHPEYMFPTFLTPPEQGWRDAYVGEGVDALWEHIQTSFEMSSRSGSNRRVYAKYCPVVQSSGMGKSRAVDEMSKYHFVIPVNLLSPESSGYPPRDQPAYDYLIKSYSREEAFLRSCSFLHALFLQTIHVVKPMAKDTVAEQFRNKMTVGMLRNRHSEWRTNFYKEVRVYHTYKDYFPSGDLSSPMVDRKLLSSDFPLRRIFRYLCKVLESQPVGDQHLSKRRKIDPEYQQSQDPSVVLAFDEIHTMAELKETKWSRFGEILRAIRGLVDESLVTLFLSVFVAIFPTTAIPNPLSRMAGMPPFCELGFDQLAVRINPSQAVTLSQITSTEHLISYGRPLWRPYLQDTLLMKFAAMKLLGGIPHSSQRLTDEDKFACLARRIPIDFLSAHHFSQVSEQEKNQVLHMRVILMAEPNFNTMVTVSSSEPMLSKAAYNIMTSSQDFSPPQTLQVILNKFAVYKNDIGELIVALLFTMARDEAIRLADPYDPPSWCSVTDLLGSLFCAPLPASQNHVDITTSHGWRFTPNGTSQLKLSLVDTFKDSKVYFTHFIKVHERTVIKLEFLMPLMLRGTAILCSTDQPGINGIIPFLLEGEEIKPDNIGVIMFQVQNDPIYTDSPEADIVRRMDSQISEIIHPSANIPVVRLFFALGANTPTLQRIKHEPSYTSMENYSAYDFWVSGLSPKILLPVVNEEAAWESILRASYPWKGIYSGLGELDKKLLMSMTPGVSTEAEFWENWCKEVPC